jgi:hypothetical protein
MAQYIMQNKFGALKSHDYHVLMQQIFPLALRCLLAPGPHMVVMRILKVFKKFYNKVWNPLDIESFQLDVLVSLVLLKLIFHHPFLTSWFIYCITS